MGAEAHLAGALEDFDTAHPADAWGVVGRRFGIGSRGHHDAVLHHRHLGGAPAIDAAQADVRKIAESFLIADVDPGDLLQHPRRTRVGLRPDLIRIKARRTPGNPRNVRPAAHHRDRCQFLRGSGGRRLLRVNRHRHSQRQQQQRTEQRKLQADRSHRRIHSGIHGG